MRYLILPTSGLETRREADHITIKHGVLIGYERRWNADETDYRDFLLWAYGAGDWREVEREAA